MFVLVLKEPLLPRDTVRDGQTERATLRARDGKRLFLGAPGSRYWQGQIYSIGSSTRLTYTVPREIANAEGKPTSNVVARNLDSRLDVIATKERGEQDDDSYMGYSVTVGDFTGDGQGGTAVGMPRGSQLLGKVLLYTWNMTNLYNLTGEQLGAYFGYSLCVVDVDGDQLDDVVVGAPMYTDLSNNEGKYDTGRIYIFYQGKQNKFQRFDVRDGTNSKCRFGLALTSLGDINKDGFADFAVGAPYDGPNERGAVYIFHGSASGAMEKHSQIIFAEDIQATLSTFGFSLSGGVDLDENEYPDIVVGAYESDTAVFLSKSDRTIHFAEKDFDVQFVLDSKKPKSPRLFFLAHEGKHIMNFTYRIDSSYRYCRSYFVYIKPTIRDKLTPLEVELRYSLKSNTQSQLSDTSRRRVSRSLAPILDLDQEQIARDSISIQTNCGINNICIPDLYLLAKPLVPKTTPTLCVAKDLFVPIRSVTHYLLGSGGEFEIDVLVENKGQDAFEAVYDLQLPPGMNYINFDRLDEERDVPVQCSAPTPQTNNTLKCDIGNPLPENKLVHFRVRLSPFHREGMKSRYEFFMRVNTTNPEVGTDSDNAMYMSIPIHVETDLAINGESHPPELHYNTSQYQVQNITTEAQIGPQVVHIYTITNKGPSDIIEAEAIILWPAQTLAVGSCGVLHVFPTPSSAYCANFDSCSATICYCGSQEMIYYICWKNQRQVDLLNANLSQKPMREKFSSTWSQNGGRPQHYSNFTYSNSSGGRAIITSGNASEYDDSGVIIRHHGTGSSRSEHIDRATGSAGGAYGGESSSWSSGRSGSMGTSRDRHLVSGEDMRGGMVHSTAMNGGDSLVNRGQHSSNETFRQSSSSRSSGRSGSVGSHSTSGEHNTQGNTTHWSRESHPHNERNTSSGGGGVYRQSSSTWSSQNSDGFDNSGGRHLETGGEHVHGGETRQSGWSSGTRSGSNVRTQSGITLGSSSGQREREHRNWSSEGISSGRDSGVGSGQHFVWEDNADNAGGAYHIGSQNVDDVLHQKHVLNPNYGIQDQYETGGGYSRQYETGSGSQQERNIGQGQRGRSEYSSSSSHSYEQNGDSQYKPGQRRRDESDSNKYIQHYITSKPEPSTVNQQHIHDDNDKSRTSWHQSSDSSHHHSRVSNINGENQLEFTNKDLDDKFTLYERTKREAGDNELNQLLECNQTKCIQIRCTLGPLAKDQDVKLAFRSRLWAKTIQKIGYHNREVKLSSLLVSRIKTLPHIGEPEQAILKNNEIFTDVIPSDVVSKSDVVPLWVVVLSACAGALILLLLIFLLWKCGFFKRNRPSNTPETVPLKRNGHYSGDEAL
uniref:Integrin alpha-2 domain-containing protein n=1 Tax=Timema poppense TaxID=170557 RepID=A0A7R9CSP8_TIMPO|nr:unnamed protein product [Timema poppensis]